MFFQTRETMLENLQRMGSACCGHDFSGEWPANRSTASSVPRTSARPSAASRQDARASAASMR